MLGLITYNGVAIATELVGIYQMSHRVTYLGLTMTLASLVGATIAYL